MIRINLSPLTTYTVLHKAVDQVLCKAPRSLFVTNQPSLISRFPFGVQPPSLSPALLERLLGKSPLRRIAARIPLEGDAHTFLETLECGHQIYSHQEFNWEPGLNWLPNAAKRRRCRECKALADSSPLMGICGSVEGHAGRSLENRATEPPRERTHGDMATSVKIASSQVGDKRFTDTPISQIPSSDPQTALPSPRKSVQSVRLTSKEKLA